jgi:thiamine biosynthesis lipoprotein
MKAILTFSLLLLMLISCSPQKAPELVVLDGSTMGTVYAVKIVPSDLKKTGIVPDSLHRQIDSLLKEINNQMSTYIPESQISGFNRYRKTDWFPVSTDLCRVIKRALDISRMSDGAFDITVGPLVNLWGFGPEQRNTLVPDETEIQARKNLVGYQKIHTRCDPPAVRKDLPGIYCDLSAIAKGFGVDKLCGYLESRDLTNFLVDIGGEIKTRGKNYQGKLWKIGVATPSEQSGVQKVVPIVNTAVATSGDYRNYFEVDTTRYSHTIDPLTGHPITHHLASVTVIADSCMLADGLATAIDVMGPDKGYHFALKQELPVFLIVRGKSGFSEKTTPAFEKILKLNQDGR